MANEMGVCAVVGGSVRGLSGRQVVVLVSHATQAPDGFERMDRFKLALKIGAARQEANRTGTVQVLCLHVPHDTVVPPVVGREADVVLVVAKARHG